MQGKKLKLSRGEKALINSCCSIVTTLTPELVATDLKSENI